MVALLISKHGELIWECLPEKLCEELNQKKLGQYDWHHGSYVTMPAHPEIVSMALNFADASGITISSPVRKALNNAQEVVNKFFSARVEMSQATCYDGELLPPLLQHLTPFQQAGTAYAVLTQRCFIADPRPEDRRAEALGAVHQVNGYPCILVGRENDWEIWKKQIQNILPDIPMFFLARAATSAPERSIWFVEYDQLESIRFSLPASINPCSIIIDHTNLFKKTNSRRSKQVSALAGRARYRYLLTDFPANISPADLREPLSLIGKLDDFARLRPFLNSKPVDPLKMSQVTGRWFEYQQKLDKLYSQLRATCLVRRAQYPGLRIQRKIESIQWTSVPEKSKQDGVSSRRNELGLIKVSGVIDWLREFIPQQPGKVLVVAQHHKVVEEIASALELPAVYGKVGNTTRGNLLKNFSAGHGSQALVISSYMNLPDSLTGVTALVLAELFLTPQQLFNFVSCICGEDNSVPLLVYHLVVFKSSQERNALQRLGVRLQEPGNMLDGTCRMIGGDPQTSP